MHSNPAKKGRINVYTFGCAKNLYDSEKLMGQLKAGFFQVVHEASLKKDDIVIVNTCGFVNDAKQESIDSILEFVEAKSANKISNLFVMGCLSQRYKEELQNEIPEVDSFFGVNNFREIIEGLGGIYRSDLLGERIITTPSHFSYLKISDGCDQKCSFCAIPLIKGKHFSVPVESLINEAKLLVSKGVKELIIIAQDTTSYGLDIYKRRILPDLLNQLADVKGLEWIRLQYAFPTKFPLEVLDVIRDRENICKYIDLPLQHISDNMLNLMRRGISKTKTLKLLDQIRCIIPEITIRTTMMVGYPGETEKDFEELYNFTEEAKFQRMGVFSYSHEEGTHAYNSNDDVLTNIKEERLSQLMALQQGISFELNQKKIGSNMKVIIDRVENGNYIGRTEFDTPEVDNEVIITSDKILKIGEFYSVKITDATDFDLFATFP